MHRTRPLLHKPKQQRTLQVHRRPRLPRQLRLLQVQPLQVQHLHLLNVVGDTRDQRWRPELADLSSRIAVDLLKDVAPQVAPEAHRRLRSEPDGSDDEDDLDETESEHHGTGSPDVAVVALQNSVVDDVGVQRRQRECRGGLNRLQHQDQCQQPLVWPEMGSEQTSQLHEE